MLYLIVTTQDNKSSQFSRLIESLNNQALASKLKVIVVNQDSEIDTEDFQFLYKVINVEKCSLSKARNIGLSIISDEECVVGFPDDDCWFNDTVLSRALELVSEQDFVCFGVYDDLRKLPYGNRPLNMKEIITLSNALTLPVSVGIFIKKSKGEKILFDEMFSVGTRWACGEETDLILEMISRGKRGIYYSYDSVYHEIENIKFENTERAYKYGLGFGALIAKCVYKRGQKEPLKIYRKVKFRSVVAKKIFLFNREKRMMYCARLRGIKDGYEEGRAYYERN